MIYLTEFVINI